MSNGKSIRLLQAAGKRRHDDETRLYFERIVLLENVTARQSKRLARVLVVSNEAVCSLRPNKFKG